MNEEDKDNIINKEEPEKVDNNQPEGDSSTPDVEKIIIDSRMTNKLKINF